MRVELSTGDFVLAPAVLVATGSTYRRTDAEGEADLIGAGVHFCATCDGPFYRGAKDLTVVGAATAASKRDCSSRSSPTRHRRAALSKLTANKLLQDKVVNHARMSVLLDTSVTSFNANESGKLESITVSCDGTESIHETPALHLHRSRSNTSFSRTRWTLTRVDLSSPTQIFARASTEFRGG